MTNILTQLHNVAEAIANEGGSDVLSEKLIQLSSHRKEVQLKVERLCVNLTDTFTLPTTKRN